MKIQRLSAPRYPLLSCSPFRSHRQQPIIFVARTLLPRRLKSRFFHQKWPYGYATRTSIGTVKAFVHE